MIIVVGGTKGGAGKTTVATNLTVMCSATGKKTLLIDADEQDSSITWANQREALGISTSFSTIQLCGKILRPQVERMKSEYQVIIIDVGRGETTSFRAALSVADVCLIPFQPRSIDIWTWGKVKTTISEMRLANPKLRALAFINRADPSGTDNEDAAEILQDCEEIQFIDTTIVNRKAFGNAATDGLGVTETKPEDRKAVHEMQALYAYLFPPKIYTEDTQKIHSVCPRCI